VEKLVRYVDKEEKIGVKLSVSAHVLERISQVASTAQIREYTRLRASGTCENCEKAAPFKDKNDQPFLEVHHINRLADDGPDIPVNVAAICPNCHREAHFGCDPSAFRERLGRKIHEREVGVLAT
jgi:5-methylcytosine-specific restriction enzyme A